MTRHPRSTHPLRATGSLAATLALLALLVGVAAPLGADAQPAASSWPQYQHDAGHTGRGEPVGPAQVRRRCQFDFEGSSVGVPVTGTDGTVYVASGSGDDASADWALHAIDPADCREEWSYPLPGAPEVAAPAVSEEGTIYLQTDAEGGNTFGQSDLMAIDTTGALVFDVDLGGAFTSTVISSPVIAADGTVWLGSMNTVLYHFQADGTPICGVSPTASSIQTTPAIAPAGTVYVLDATNTLVAYDAGCHEQWHLGLQPFSGGESSPAVGPDGTVYVGAGHDLVAVHPNGTEAWRRTTGWTVMTAPAIAADGTVYVASDGLYAFTPAGVPLWDTDCHEPFGDAFSEGSPIVGGDGSLYYGASFGLCGLTPAGDQRWHHEIDPGTGPNMALTTDGALLVTGGGDLGSAPFLQVLEPAPRPDARIRKATAATYKGDGVYNTTGAGQTVGAGAARGGTVTYYVSAQNDAPFAAALRLRGTASTTRFRIKYTANGSGITNGVTAGTYLTPVLAPQATFTVKVQVTVATNAPAGASLTAGLHVFDPALEYRDTVKFTTRRA